MEVLGFRRPQFSEEAAWLPEWLQNSQTTSADKLTNESEIKVSEGGERETSEEGRYNNCHLYLSGSDELVSSLRSTASVLHLNLHLSSDGTLQYTQGSSLNNHPLETVMKSSTHSEKVSIPVEVRQNTEKLNSTGNLGSESLRAKLTTRENPALTPIFPFSKEKHIKKIKNRHHKHGNFDHTVELSIAASEILIIREILKNCKTLPEVEAPALLDISLNVKQARLLGVAKDSLSNDQLNESCEYLSDLDDSAMVDAFEDVGLCTTSSDYCNLGPATVSRVNESPQHDPEASCNLGNLEVPNPERDSNSASKSNSEESWDMDTEVKFTKGKYPILNYDIGGLEFLGSGQTNAKFQSTELQAGFNLHNLDSSSTQPQLGATANSSRPQDHNVHDFQMKHPPSGRNNSCWLGVCTRKFKDDFPGLSLDTIACTAKAFAVETSSLSESVDVPDKSSYVDRHESKHLISLQACKSASVVPSANSVEGEPLISPEFAKDSGSVSVDPLCSFVPCSFLSETPQTMHNRHIFRKCGKYLDVSEPCLTSKVAPGRLNIPSGQMVKGHSATTLNEKNSDQEVDNQLDAFNNNSVVLLSRPEIRTVQISDEQLLFQSNIEKQSCYSKNKKNTSMACGNALTTAPCINSTSSATSSSTGLPTIGSIADDVTVSTNNAEGGARFLPEQQLSAFNRKGRNLPQASEGLCSDKTLDCTASQRELDDIPLRKKSHAPQTGAALDIKVLHRKRVHFKEDTSEQEESTWINFKKRKTNSKLVSNLKSKMLLASNLDPDKETFSQEVKKKLTNYRPCTGDKLIFRGLEFLLTGLPKKRVKEIEQLIIRYGGIVLFDIPPHSSREKLRVNSEFQKLPVVLCLKKVETTKFLYGCAVKACILKVNWLLDSVSARSVLQPEKYMIFENGSHAMLRSPHPIKLVFEGVGVMFHGKHRFCSRFSNIFKVRLASSTVIANLQYGGGNVYKALQRLVQSCERKKLSIQLVVAEDRSTVSRHLKHCATERNIPIVSATWIISSLLSGKLLPFTENDYHVPKFTRNASREMLSLSSCMSQEI